MTLSATLHERMAAQVAERRETGRPLQAGDLLWDAGQGFSQVTQAISAGDYIEALVNDSIRAIRREKQE